MAYAAVKVFSPSDAKAEYQSLFADAEGRVAFVPNESGVWRIIADDGMGHRSEMELPYQTAPTVGGKAVVGQELADSRADHAGSSETFSPVTLAWKALLGVSLLLNLALLAKYWSRRRAVKDHAS